MSDDFEDERRINIARMTGNKALGELTLRWMLEACRYRYTYNFDWLGQPVIQFPQDLLAMQEILWRIRPSVVVETGIARGGSVLFYASILELIDRDGLVLGIDIEIRPENRQAIEKHPLSKRVRMIQGSSVDDAVVSEVRRSVGDRRPVVVVLDSNHTEAHVLRELELYSPLVTAGSYLVVFDTLLEQFPADFYPDRPWAPGNSPATAVRRFLETTDRFMLDTQVERRLLVTAAPGGYLCCTRD